MWIASLSNGETIFEQPPVEGEVSSWQKLLTRLREEKDLTITQMRLQAGKRTVISIPNATDYVHVYEVRRYLNTDEPQTLKQGVGVVFGDNVFLNWINDQGDVWQDIRPLESLKIHSTLA